MHFFFLRLQQAQQRQEGGQKRSSNTQWSLNKLVKITHDTKTTALSYLQRKGMFSYSIQSFLCSKHCLSALGYTHQKPMMSMKKKIQLIYSHLTQGKFTQCNTRKVLPDTLYSQVQIYNGCLPQQLTLKKKKRSRVLFKPRVCSPLEICVKTQLYFITENCPKVTSQASKELNAGTRGFARTTGGWKSACTKEACVWSPELGRKKSVWGFRIFWCLFF